MRKTLSLLILASVMMLTACVQGAGVTHEAFDQAIRYCANAGGLNSLYGKDYAPTHGWWKYQAVCNNSSVVSFTMRK